ncbi:MAG: hypothetical protein ABIJ18_05775 [archaeon]
MTKPRNDINEFPEIASLAASAKNVVGQITLNNTRTVTLTIKATSIADATSSVRANLYYSPTGEREDWDTIPFAYFDINLVTAATTQQESKNIDAPEKGFIKLEIENLDAVKASTFIQSWLSINRWGLL